MKSRHLTRLIALVIVLAMTVAVFTGCQGEKETKTQEPDTKVTDAKEGTTDNEADVDSRAMEGNMYLKGYPIVEKPVTIEIAAIDWWNNSVYNEHPVAIKYAEKTNVNVEFIQITDSEKINLMFSSNDLPDGFMACSTDTEKYGQQGMLLEVSELIDKYAPNISLAMKEVPMAKVMNTNLEGKMYTIPNIFRYDDERIRGIQYINKSWLDNLGLGLPETTDEFYNTLVAFKENDCNGNGDAKDEVPYTLKWGDSVTGITSWFGSWGTSSAYNTPFIIKNGELIASTYNNDDYKKAIKFYNKLYEEGLLDPESFTQDGQKIRAKREAEQPFVGVLTTWDNSSMPEDYVALPPLAGPDGERNYIESTDYGIWDNNYISASSENPLVVLRWMDGIAEPEESILWNRGPIDVTIRVNEDGKYEELPYDEAGVYRTDVAFVFPTLGLTDSWVKENYEPSASAKMKMEQMKLFDPYVTMQAMGGFFKFTEEQVTFLSTYEVDINTYCQDKEVEWIINGNIDDEWDAYNEQLKTMQFEKLWDIYKEAWGIVKSELN